LYVHAKTSLNSFNNCSASNTLFIPIVHWSPPVVVLHQFPGWVSSIVGLQLTSIQLSIIPMLWFLLEFCPPQHSFDKYVLWYILFSRTTSNSYMLLVVFCFVICITYSSFELLVFTLISMISTFVVFTN
jgi:hypothetical protein